MLAVHQDRYSGARKTEGYPRVPPLGAEQYKASFESHYGRISDIQVSTR